METDGRGNLSDRDSQMAGSFEGAVEAKRKKKFKKAIALPLLRANEALTVPAEKPAEATSEKTLPGLPRTKEHEPAEQPPRSLTDAEQLLDELDDPLEALAPTANPEQLSEPEKQAIAQQLIAARREQLGQELHTAPQNQEEQILTDAAFIDNLENLVAQTGELNDEILDHAVQHTMNEFDLPAPAALPNTLTPPERPGSRGTDLLIGGMGGYLIGRRRGRAQTEAQLLPIQQKLEGEVRDMHDKINQREETIRSLTNQKIASEGLAAREAVVQKMEAKARPPERAPVTQAEHVGAVLLPHTELAPPRPETPHAETTPTLTKESVSTMPETELLQIATKLEVAGISAKALYEQGRISKEDLRSVVAEYAGGNKNYQQLLLEKLHTVPPESMEFLSPNAGKPTGQGSDDTVTGGGNAVGGVPVDTQSETSDSKLPGRPTLAIPGQPLSDHRAMPKPASPNPNTWYALLAFVGVATIFVLFLFF